MTNKTTTTITITKKQQEILKLLYRYRYLNRIQIQAFLKHKNKKTINLWLKDLNDKEYTKRIYSNKLGKSTKPAVYYLGLEGIRFLRLEADCSKEVLRKRSQEKTHSDSFIDQCLLVPDIVLHLIGKIAESKQNGNELSYAVATATDLAHTRSTFNFLAELKTDLLVIKREKKKAASKAKTSHFLFTLLAPNLPNYSIKKKINNLIDFYYEGAWEDNTGKSFPVAVFICPTRAMLAFAKRTAKQLLEENDFPEDLRIRFALLDEVKTFGVIGEILGEAN